MLLRAASQAEHFGAIMDEPEYQLETPAQLRRLFSLRRHWRTDAELTAIAEKRLRGVIPFWVEWTRDSLVRAREALDDDLRGRTIGPFGTVCSAHRRIYEEINMIRLRSRAAGAGIVIVRSFPGKPDDP